jgi:hypothetical protein
MFKTANCQDELLESMEKNLVAHQVENQYGFQKLARAIDCLNAAAEIFEQADMPEVSEQIAVVLQDLVEK